jgi:protoporphyrinogen oxidase
MAMHLSILGGGPAGLAAGYFAARESIPFVIYERGERPGGCCVTLQHGAHRFDSGAHRIHDRDSSASAELLRLLDGELARVDVPSLIHTGGRLVPFPLSPLAVVPSLGLRTAARALCDLVRARLPRRARDTSFEEFAVRRYGRTLAERFLLGYSEKLWGVPCRQLSPEIAGRRLKGIDVRLLLRELSGGRRRRTEHLEGPFFYPSRGIGAVTSRLAAVCGAERIRTGARVTRLVHDGDRIRAVELNGRELAEVDQVVSSLPLSELVQMLDPAVPDELLALARRLRYRSLILVALFLRRARVLEAATLYFPDRSYPFTRVYEPKVRSRLMSPPDRTCLVAELPCFDEDELARTPDSELVSTVSASLVRSGLVAEREVEGSVVHRMSHAYPVLELGSEARAARLLEHLGRFDNLRVTGRNGRFIYAWVDDMMRLGKELVQSYGARA